MTLSRSGAIVWPDRVLRASTIVAEVVPFTRSGGRSLSGLERVTRTDRGWWSIRLDGVLLETRPERQCWNAIRTLLGGRAGLVAVPLHSREVAPYPGGLWRRPLSVSHSDGATFSDGSGYRQRVIAVKAATLAPIGATSMRFAIIDADLDLVGARFSYELAAYEIGGRRGDGSYAIAPAVRAPIPAGADLEFDQPTCLCRLADDRAMAHSVSIEGFDSHSVSFVEATEWWSDLAAGLL